jgi:hypothetical protein
MTESGQPHRPPDGYPPPPPYPYPYHQDPYPYQQSPYPAGYPPPPPAAYSAGFTPPPLAPKNGLGIASLVIAIVGLLTTVGGIVLGIVAVIIGFVARGRVKRGEANNGGVAIAGIVLGFLAVLAAIAWVAIAVICLHEVGFTNYVDCMNGAGQNTDQQLQCETEFKDQLQNRFSVTLTPPP